MVEGRVAREQAKASTDPSATYEWPVAELSAYQLLTRCAKQHQGLLSGGVDVARAAFKEWMQAPGKLAALAEADYEGDRAAARRHILEAFKRGLDDHLFVREYRPVEDFMPEWTWEEDEAERPVRAQRGLVAKLPTRPKVAA
jgi:hypothetical protein